MHIAVLWVTLYAALLGDVRFLLLVLLALQEEDAEAVTRAYLARAVEEAEREAAANAPELVSVRLIVILPERS